MITDDALGTNTLSLSGADAALFEIVGGTSCICGPARRWTSRRKSLLNVTVEVDDVSVGSDSGRCGGPGDHDHRRQRGAQPVADQHGRHAGRRHEHQQQHQGGGHRDQRRCPGHQHAEPLGRRCGPVRAGRRHRAASASGHDAGLRDAVVAERDGRGGRRQRRSDAGRCGAARRSRSPMSTRRPAWRCSTRSARWPRTRTPAARQGGGHRGQRRCAWAPTR